MHLAYQPDQFKNGPPAFSHSVYGVGQNRPDIRGLVNFNNNAGDFKLSEEEALRTGLGSPLFFNTGKMTTNPECSDCPSGVSIPELKLNDFVVYD